MEMKQFTIKTTDDMISCTNEDNIDLFLTDLRSYLTTAHLLKKVVGLIGTTEDEKKLGSDGFTWIDDGKHNATVRLRKKE